MSLGEKLFKKSYAKELFGIAESDYVTGQVLAQASESQKKPFYFTLNKQ